MSATKRPSPAQDIRDKFLSVSSAFSRKRGTQKPNLAVEGEIGAYFMYRRVLLELCINRFKWSGLPKSVDPRFLETSLHLNALSVFYFDRDPRVSAFLALAGGGTGRPNMMGNPTAFRVYRQPLPSLTLTHNQCVPIWANTARTPDLDIIEYYARRFARWDTTLEINAMNARQTKIVSTDENSRLTGQNINRQIVEGQPTIFVDTQTGQRIADTITVLDLGIDLMGLEKLSIVRSRVWSECMNLLGINAASTEKKERVVTDEVDQNNDQVQSSRNVALNSRQYAAQQINDRYGLSVSVEYKSDLDGILGSESAMTYIPGANDPGHTDPEVER